MGISFSRRKAPLPEVDKSQDQDEPQLVITGLGTQRPDNALDHDGLREFALSLHPQKPEWLQHLLQVSERTGIESRGIVEPWKIQSDSSPEQTLPTAEQTDQTFRTAAPALAGGAARKALRESGFPASAITHLVAVTSTNFGSPGYDLLVARELGLPLDVNRILISGVGCAGGLSALRVASNVANGEAFRGKPCRILIVACEMCSIHIRSELQAASATGWISIGPALFGDGAASMVLCNSLGLSQDTPRIYSVVDWRTKAQAPQEDEPMWYRVTQWGFRLHLSREVPMLAAESVPALATSLCEEHCVGNASILDWALHPGGGSIIKGVQKAMDLSDHQLRATWDVYRRQGNTSSVSVLAVLDRLRSMGPGARDVMACSFGPGLMTEMALLKRLNRGGDGNEKPCMSSTAHNA